MTPRDQGLTFATRTIRIPDELWNQLQGEAEARSTLASTVSVSELVRIFCVEGLYASVKDKNRRKREEQQP